jgi:hypothetical protein
LHVGNAYKIDAQHAATKYLLRHQAPTHIQKILSIK